MAEVAVNLAKTDRSARRAAAGARCLRCSTDLSRLPEGGRYCPRCGLDSYSSPPAAIRSRAAERPSAARADELDWGHLTELSAAGPSHVPPTVIPSPGFRSEILRGYANALYKLGRRHEIVGSRNPREAIRCYLKAARLGNMMAFARLATRWIERCDRTCPTPGANVAPIDDAKAPSS